MPNLILADSIDEQIIWQSRPAWRDFIFLLLLGTALLPILGIGVFVFVYVSIARLRHLYVVTEERCASQEGLLCRHLSEIDIVDVRDISLDQSFLQRLLRTGDLGLSSAGQDGIEVVFKGIGCPEQVKEMVRRRKRELQCEMLRESSLLTLENGD